MSESSGLGGLGGGVGDVQGTSVRRGAQAPGERDYAAEARSRQQGRNGATDFAAITHVFGSQQLQEPLPPYEFRWLGPERGGQREFAQTFNTARMGLEMQRGRADVAYGRMSDSSLVTHAGDRASLPFETRTQDLQILNYLGANSPELSHAELEGRAVIAPRYGSSVYVEASIHDPTLELLTTVDGFIYSLANVIIDGKQQIVILTYTGAHFISALSPLTFEASNKKFTVEDRDGGGQVTAVAIVQSLTPGLPLIVCATVDDYYLVGIEPSTDNGDRYGQKANLMLRRAGLSGSNLPIGFGTVGNLQPAAYVLQTNGNGNNGALRTRLISVNAYAILLQDHQVSMDPVLGAAFCRQRGLIVLHNGDRVITWNGREEDLQIFLNEPSHPGYRVSVRGVWEHDGAVFAAVDELPFAPPDVYAIGRCRTQIRRYDFEMRKWSAVSAWYVWAEEGSVIWYPGGPSPAQVSGHHGYVGAIGGPDLPFGPLTRNMHTLTSSMTLQLNATASVSWSHKYEPTPATDPYSLNGSSYGRAPTGAVRWPAMIFEAGYEYVDKYYDYIETAGEDSGDTGSSWTVRVGEGGQLDELAPPPSEVTFENPVVHQDRRRAFTGAATSFLFPQVELVLTRGDQHNKTPQGLPFTLYGHVDMHDSPATPMRRTPGRSDG